MPIAHCREAKVPSLPVLELLYRSRVAAAINAKACRRLELKPTLLLLYMPEETHLCLLSLLGVEARCSGEDKACRLVLPQ